MYVKVDTEDCNLVFELIEEKLSSDINEHDYLNYCGRLTVLYQLSLISFLEYQSYSKRLDEKLKIKE